MAEIIKTKHFITITEKDSMDTNPSSLKIQFNNPAFTSIQNNMKAKTYITPLFLTVNFAANNVSEALKNNRFTVKVGSLPAQTIVLSDGYYTGSSLLEEVKTQLLNKVNWASTGSQFVDFSNSFYDTIKNTFNFKIEVPSPAIAGSPSIVYNFKPTGYDSSDIFGFSASVTQNYPTSTVRTVSGDNTVDLQGFEVIQVRSNIAKSTYQKIAVVDSSGVDKGYSILSPTNILYNIPTDNIQPNGTILTWAPPNVELYKQEVSNNLDYMTFDLTTTDGKNIILNSLCEVCFHFILEREIYPQTAQEKLNALQTYVNWS